MEARTHAMHGFLAGLRRALRGPCQIAPGTPVVVAVSGGADSMALLHGLARLPPRHRHPLVVAHLDHQLRGEDSREDAAFVREWSLRLGLAFHSESIPVRDAAGRTREGLETTARNIRHQFLARVATRLGIRHVALAHHARDQAELFFLRLLRGSSPEGLAGMTHASPSPAEPSVTLVRPFLAEDPGDLRAWLAHQRLPWREDASNADTGIPRNAIRHELLPVLERIAGHAFVRSIVRTMDVLRAESGFIDEELARRLDGSLDDEAARLPLPLRRRMIVRNLIALGHEPTHELVQHLASRPGKPRHVRGGKALASTNAAEVRPVRPSTDASAAAPAVVVTLRGERGSLRLAHGRITWRITRRRPRFPAVTSGAPADVAWFDAAMVGRKIMFRTWQHGDRFHPLGAPGSSKVGDLFTNRRVPRDQRAHRLVAVAPDSSILWLHGWPCGHAFRITDATRRFLRLGWFPAGPATEKRDGP